MFIHYGNVDSPFKGQYSAREKDQQPSDIKDENEESKIENKSEIKTIVLNPSFLVKESQYNGITAATNQFLEKNNEDLLKIFQFYCSLGEPMNTNKMKSIKFKKLLIDANIMNVLIFIIHILISIEILMIMSFIYINRKKKQLNKKNQKMMKMRASLKQIWLRWADICLQSMQISFFLN